MKSKDGKGFIESKVELVPELLKSTGLNEEQKSDFRVMNEVGKFTIMRPK